MLFKKQIQGIENIARHLGVWHLVTLFDWRIGYNLPIRKVSGIWVANKKDLKKWRRAHLDLDDSPPIIERVKIKQPRPRRWGLEKRRV